MQVKEYLRQISKERIEYDDCIRQLEEMRTDAAAIKAIVYDKARVQTSPSKTSPMEQIIDRMVDMEAELSRAENKYWETRKRISSEIKSLDDERYTTLLLMRYVDGLSLVTIAEKMHYSYDWTKRIHGHALLVFGKKFGLDTKTPPKDTEFCQ